MGFLDLAEGGDVYNTNSTLKAAQMDTLMFTNDQQNLLFLLPYCWAIVKSLSWFFLAIVCAPQGTSITQQKGTANATSYPGLDEVGPLSLTLIKVKKKHKKVTEHLMSIVLGIRGRRIPAVTLKKQHPAL